MIGRELADPFYSTKPDRFAPWDRARVVALFPNVFDPDGWTDPPVYFKENGTRMAGTVSRCLALPRSSQVISRKGQPLLFTPKHPVGLATSGEPKQLLGFPRPR